jgi:hypothetical protein
MENGNADLAVWKDVRVKDLRDKSHARRVERVVLWEDQPCDEHPVLERAAFGSCNGGLPFKEIVLWG